MKNTPFKALVAFLLTAGAAILTGGCNLEPSVPGMPTYEADVKPILEARCIRCHDYPGLQGAPADRFDLYECPSPDGSAGPCTRAARDLALSISGRVHLGSGDALRMPRAPAAPLSPYQIDIIGKWAAENPPLER
jgi:hypothetical protein